MEIKKFNINGQTIDLKILDHKHNYFDFQINSHNLDDKKLSVKLIYFNPKTDICAFEVDGIIHKAKLLEYSHKNKKTANVYIFDSSKNFEVTEEKEFLVHPAKRDTSNVFLSQPLNCHGEFELNSPIGGKLIKLLVQNNQKVRSGDPVVIIESMKMENEINANCDGYVKNIFISEGNLVQPKQLLLSFKKE
jgi:biotin carboxyl carrier protein